MVGVESPAGWPPGKDSRANGGGAVVPGTGFLRGSLSSCKKSGITDNKLTDIKQIMLLTFRNR